MCGIAGFITSKPGYRQALTLRGLLVANQTRGAHASGVYTSSNQQIFKRAVAAEDLIALPEFPMGEMIKSHIVLAHTRYATIGAKEEDNNAHPFESGDVVGVHNGSIYNYKTIFPEAVVDSQAIFHQLEIDKDPALSFPKLSGQMAVAYIKKGEELLHLYKHGNPLHSVQTEDGLFFSSLADDLELMMSVIYGPVRALTATEDTHYSINMNGEIVDSKSIIAGSAIVYPKPSYPPVVFGKGNPGEGISIKDYYNNDKKGYKSEGATCYDCGQWLRWASYPYVGATTCNLCKSKNSISAPKNRHYNEWSGELQDSSVDWSDELDGSSGIASQIVTSYMNWGGTVLSDRQLVLAIWTVDGCAKCKNKKNGLLDAPIGFYLNRDNERVYCSSCVDYTDLRENEDLYSWVSYNSVFRKPYKDKTGKWFYTQETTKDGWFKVGETFSKIDPSVHGQKKLSKKQIKRLQKKIKNGRVLNQMEGR